MKRTLAGSPCWPQLIATACSIRLCRPWLPVITFVCRHGKRHAGPRHRIRGGWHVSRVDGGSPQKESMVVTALAGHGVFDFFHQIFIQNPGVPIWLPGFCLSSIFRWRFPGRAADAAVRICNDNLEFRQSDQRFSFDRVASNARYCGMCKRCRKGGKRGSDRSGSISGSNPKPENWASCCCQAIFSHRNASSFSPSAASTTAIE